jgi:hypothetical protein
MVTAIYTQFPIRIPENNGTKNLKVASARCNKESLGQSATSLSAGEELAAKLI